MVEIGTALVFYQDQRDRLATRLPSPHAGKRRTPRRGSTGTASLEVGSRGRWESGSSSLSTVEPAAADSGKREAAPPTAEAAGQKRAWPWASPRFTRWAAAAGAVFVAVGAGAILAATRGGGSAGFVRDASPAVGGRARAPAWLWPSAGWSRSPRVAKAGEHGGSQVEGPRARASGEEAGQAVLTASDRHRLRPPFRKRPPLRLPRPPRSRPPLPRPLPRPAEPPAPEPRPDPKPQPDARLLPCRPPSNPCRPPVAPEAEAADPRWQRRPVSPSSPLSGAWRSPGPRRRSPIPIPLAPDDGGEFTARVDQIAFQASTAVSPDPGPHRSSTYREANGVGSDGVLSSPIDDLLAGPQGAPPVYQAGPGSDPSWPNRPPSFLLAGRLPQLHLRRPQLLRPDSNVVHHRPAATASPDLASRRRHSFPTATEEDLFGSGCPLVRAGRAPASISSSPRTPT